MSHILDRIRSLSSAVLARALSVVLTLEEPDRTLALSSCQDGTEESLADAIRKHLVAVQRARRAASVPVPDFVPDKAGWTASVLGVAEQPGSGSPGSSLEAANPELVKVVQRTATSATERLPGTEAATQRHRAALDDSQTRKGFQLARTERSAPLFAASRKLKKTEVALALLETVLAFSAFGQILGVFDRPVRSVPASTWVQVAGSAAACTVVTLLLAIFVSRLLRRFQGSRLLAASGLAVAGGGLALAGLSLGILRYVAGLPASQLSDVTTNFSALAMFLLVTIGSLTLAVAVAACDFRRREIEQRAALALRDEQTLDSNEARLCNVLTQAEQELDVLRTQAKLPERLGAAFESAVNQARLRILDDEAETQDRISRACAVFRQLSTLSPAERDEVFATLYELKVIDEEVPTNGGGRPISSSPAALAVVAAAILPFMGGCGGPVLPISTAIVADGTGASSADTANPQLLAQALSSWASEALVLPESRFVVVTSADSYGSTVVHEPLVVPSSWQGDPRAAREAWRQAGVARVRGIPIPTDASSGPVNHSDLLSAVAVAIRQLGGLDGHRKRLLIATDGRFVSLGYNTERRVPEPEEALERMAREGLSWQLSGFESVELCGLHHRGTAPALSAARDTLWRELLLAGGASSPSLRPSCRGLFGLDPTPSTPAAPLVAAFPSQLAQQASVVGQAPPPPVLPHRSPTSQSR